MRYAISLALSAALALAQAPSTNPAQGLNFYSIEKEVALGKGLADDVMRQSRVLEDPAVTEYVNRVAQNVWSAVDSPIPLTVRVLEDDAYNSIVLPGGFLFVNTGLLEATGTEAELAAVLSHQLAHIAARHGTKQDTRGQIANLASVPLIFTGGRNGYSIRQDAQVALPLGFLAFSRGFEFEADALGLQYLVDAGYDPSAYLAFFAKLQALEPDNAARTSQLFSTHPPTEDRITRTQEAIANLEPRTGYRVTTSEFERMQQRLIELREQRTPAAPENNAPPTLRQQFI